MIHSERSENPTLRIETIGVVITDDRWVDEGRYCIAFSMLGGGKKYWDYFSKEQRDREYERVKKEINTAR
ncbi:hypothetical protein CAP35_00445 [Chitinophagaceae bacterium IBVUCB1]|nr:hypothetical protein CAP35_00445 [Chitinophagaceae bacterium IBVUCB1]